MFFSTNLLDEIFEIRNNNTWKSYLWSVFSFMVNFPLEIFCFLKLQLYLYFITQPKYRISSNLLESTLTKQTPHTHTHNSSEIKLLSWNIQFGNGTWQFNNLVKSINFMRDMNLDIILLQEVLVTDGLDQVDIIKKCLGLTHHIYYPNYADENIKMGNVVFSRFPITSVYEDSTFQIVKVKLDTTGKYSNQDLYCINVHLASDLLCQKQKNKIKKIIQKIKNIKSETENHHITTRVIMAGDFNLLTWCENLKILGEEISVVPNNEYTYPSNYPLVKYDYAFQLGLEDNIKLEVMQTTLSDHLPLLIKI